MKLKLKISGKAEIEYKDVRTCEIVGEFLVISYKLNPKIIRTEPISLEMINFWETEA
jgi:hypothetical protein